MEQVTVKKLAAHLNALVATGHGDNLIVISDDNEGNGYHGLSRLTDSHPDQHPDEYEHLISDTITGDLSKLVILG